MGRDWVEWHRPYRDKSSALSHRLETVQQELTRSLVERPGRARRLISVCAGQGDDVLGVLATHRDLAPRRARLVELDPRNVQVARRRIAELGLADIEVVQGDAGLLSSYEGVVPAEIVLVCGVFGNVSDRDILRTIDALPQLVDTGARVIWTRTRRDPDYTPVIRRHFIEVGFVEETFVAPDEYLWSVGVNRFEGEPEPLGADSRLFTFTT